MINYRKATMDDLDDICKMVRCAVNHMIEQHILQWDERYPKKEDFQLDIEKNQLYIGVVDDQIAVAYVLNQEYDEEYKNGNWKYTGSSYYIIHRLCVHPLFQNQGVAKRTLVHIEDELTSIGIQSIRLDVFSENPFALKLYSNCGYSTVGHVDWRKGRFLLMEKEFRKVNG